VDDVALALPAGARCADARHGAIGVGDVRALAQVEQDQPVAEGVVRDNDCSDGDVQRALDDLPAGVRDEAEQEIALAVLDGKITVGELGDPAKVRDLLRAAARAGNPRKWKHVSLDQQIADGLRLIDMLAG
jgi:hypothetical protein